MLQANVFIRKGLDTRIESHWVDEEVIDGVTLGGYLVVKIDELTMFIDESGIDRLREALCLPKE